VGLVADAAAREAIRAELKGLATVEFCNRAAELFRLASNRRTDAVFAEPRDAAGRRTAPVLQSLAVSRPRLQVVMYLELTIADVRDALERWTSGVVIKGHEAVGPMLRSALARAPHIGSPGAVLASTAAFVPPEVRRFFIHCAWRASRIGTAQEAAAGARIPYRTLAEQLEAAGLPTPKVVLSWYRLLHAAWELELTHSSREKVAVCTGFSSGAKLAAALRRCANMSWTELRERVGFGGLLQLFEELIGAPAERGKQPPVRAYTNGSKPDDRLPRTHRKRQSRLRRARGGNAARATCETCGERGRDEDGSK
jgi:AraC-like DNA-binding protein